jgi:nucleoside-diphosphate-sugar epimerase
MPGVLEQDLDAALERTRQLWTEMDGSRLLLTGATGFVGTLMLESIRHARARAGSELRVVATVRDRARLHERLPWTARAAWLDVVCGDVRTFTMPGGSLDFAIHAANTASPAEISADPEGVAAMVVDGSVRVRDLAAAAGVRRMLQLSSGSVCGAHFVPSPPIIEDDRGVPQGDGPAACLARAKRDAERTLLTHASANGPAIVFARGYALCGPWLPLDSDFAFGNFIGAAMRGEAVVVSGDGSPVRSYLYGEDLIVWLWTLLLKGFAGRAYNVGSEHAVTIGELAHRVAALLGSTVTIAGTAVPGARAHWHVPDTSRARSELGLLQTVALDDAIVRTAQWWRERRVGHSVGGTT